MKKKKASVSKQNFVNSRYGSQKQVPFIEILW